MYCERCNIDFSEGLRYCKWCGGELKERRRDTSELKTCPSCKAAVKTGWTFCKSCGAKLSAPVITSTSPVGSETSSDSVICSNCGERLDETSLYCKGCGSPVKQTTAPYATSSMLCAACNSYSPVGSVACTVCGFPFAAPAQPRPARAPDTLIDTEERTNTRPDLSASLSTADRPVLPDGTIEMASYPAADAGAREPSTAVISSSEPTDRIAASGPSTGPQNLDNLKTITMESETVAIEQDTLMIDASTGGIGSAPGTQLPGEGQTAIFPDDGEARPDKSAKTTVLDRGRTTGSVEEQRAEEGTSAKDAATRPISDMESRIDVSGQTISQFGAPVGEQSNSLGTAPPSASGELRPESQTGGTGIIGSGTAEQSAPLPGGFNDTPTIINDTPAIIDDEPDLHTPDPRTAPFGLDQPPPLPQAVPMTQQPWSAQQGMPPPMEMPATRMMPAPAQPSRTNWTAIISVLAAVLIIAIGGLAAWWYFVGGPRSEQARQQEVTVDPPAPEPPPPPPVPEVKPPVVPEGMALVPGGQYVIGSDNGDELARPQRTIDLSPFYIDTTEVTNAEYMLFVDATKREPPVGWQDGQYPQDRANWPVTGVSWQDAADYAAWAGKRLPTEVEWEAAARGSDGRVYPWGNEWKRGLANIGTSGIKEVGQFTQGASPFGILDMLGNVWEWTADELALYPGSTAQLPSSLKPGITYRVIRGGAYDGDKETDASYRGFVDSSQGYPKTGFRCVKDAK